MERNLAASKVESGAADDVADDPARVETLIRTINRLSSELASHKVSLRLAERRSRIAKFVGVIGIGVASVGILVGSLGVGYGHDAQATADDVAVVAAAAQTTADDVTAVAAAIVAQREETRSGQCVQQNVTTANEREAIVNSLIALVPPGTTLTPTQEATIDRYRKEVEARLPYRDCTVEGIAKYYKDPPQDPNGH